MKRRRYIKAVTGASILVAGCGSNAESSDIGVNNETDSPQSVDITVSNPEQEVIAGTTVELAPASESGSRQSLEDPISVGGPHLISVERGNTTETYEWNVLPGEGEPQDETHTLEISIYSDEFKFVETLA